jgi:hypothetical protein
MAAGANRVPREDLTRVIIDRPVDGVPGRLRTRSASRSVTRDGSRPETNLRVRPFVRLVVLALSVDVAAGPP